ncbi:hypothetical protein R3P38DRAFT_2760194 [Favolaschia claudopus]|uniref:Uncharacterized protein n=1 Tax=Favolaschia claudopus TaxID=2862362 RepID=A0AAW0E2M5_9AGAR
MYSENAKSTLAARTAHAALWSSKTNSKPNGNNGEARVGLPCLLARKTVSETQSPLCNDRNALASLVSIQVSACLAGSVYRVCEMPISLQASDSLTPALSDYIIEYCILYPTPAFILPMRATSWSFCLPWPEQLKIRSFETKAPDHDVEGNLPNSNPASASKSRRLSDLAVGDDYVRILYQHAANVKLTIILNIKDTYFKKTRQGKR